MSNFIKIRLFEGRIILFSFNSRFYIIGVGRFRILGGGGGARFRILGGGAKGGGQIPSRHMTS